MSQDSHPSRVVWTATICTALALFGDATMYAVLPSQYQAVGISTLQVGYLLSVNRLVRLPLNLPSGWLAGRLGPKWPYVLGLAIGALSTLGYGLARGIGWLLPLRALWGVAWALLVVAAYAMILAVSTERTRGRYTGIYASFSFFGGAIGAMLGGFLVDTLGFANAMFILGGCSSLACLAALTLPRLPSAHERGTRVNQQASARTPSSPTPQFPRLGALWTGLRELDARLWLIVCLNFAHRFFFAGVFNSTLGLYLRSTLGERASIGPWVVGIASLTGTLLFVRNVLTVLIGPGGGHLSDHLGERRRVLLMGEAAGALGLICMAINGSPVLLGLSILMVAGAEGLVPPMLVSWMGDITRRERRAMAVGGYQTMGDLGSGLGPLVAYPLAQWLGLPLVYALAAGCLLAAAPLIWHSSRPVEPFHQPMPNDRTS